MNFSELPEFVKEYKRLAKKYRSILSDLQEFKNVVSVVPLGNSKHFNIIIQTKSVKIIKARFFCRYLKGSSLRIIYSYFETKKKIEFIEMYFKGDKENEDKKKNEAIYKISRFVTLKLLPRKPLLVGFVEVPDRAPQLNLYPLAKTKPITFFAPDFFNIRAASCIVDPEV